MSGESRRNRVEVHRREGAGLWAAEVQVNAVGAECLRRQPGRREVLRLCRRELDHLRGHPQTTEHTHLATPGAPNHHSVGFVLTRAADFSVKPAQAPRPYGEALVKTTWGGSNPVACQPCKTPLLVVS